ncbi:MAG: hypothetical protein CHACPFDD_02332 [Phycisphaerae bacterium]|nr:hypothetical protein [Phycisphaerae bacterium]
MSRVRAALLLAAAAVLTPAVWAQVTDLNLCIDVSGSINATELGIEIDGLKSCVGDPTLIPQDGTVNVGITVFAEGVKDILGLTNYTPGNVNTVLNALEGLKTNRQVGLDGTYLAAGLESARVMLVAGPATNDLILLTGDGAPFNDPLDINVVTASLVRDGITVCAIAVGATDEGKAVLQAIATATGGGYGEADDFNDFEALCRGCFDFFFGNCLNPTVNTDPGLCTARVACSEIGECFDDDGEPLPISCDPPGPYDVGTTPVTITCDGGTYEVTRECFVTVRDLEPPVIDCPDNVTVSCEDSIDPSETGEATATDNCGIEEITYSDQRNGGECQGSITRTWTAEDIHGNRASCTQTITLVNYQDRTSPTISCNIVGNGVDPNCEKTVTFSATIDDNCCVLKDDVLVEVVVTSGNASLTNIVVNKIQTDGNTVTVSGSALVSDLLSCPAIVQLTVNADDCCGNPAHACIKTAEVKDEVPPEIDCPDDITVEHGSFLCGDEVSEWLNSATATDNCDAVVDVTNDAPDCGFAYDSKTKVTWTATDSCGNTATCSAYITVLPAQRGRVGKKGSLLVFPFVELVWDANGDLVQDTIISLSNDGPGNIYVKSYFINGDPATPAAGGERAHPGCNKVDNHFLLTAEEPTYWSAASGQPKGLSSFTILDDGDPPGRPDPDDPASGNRVLRGYIILWATDVMEHEIRWNHLTGHATIVNLQKTEAWEYNATAYGTRCVDQGDEPLDCVSFDANGVCCDAYIIPGNLDFDGFQYDFAFGQLLLEFYAETTAQRANTAYTGASTAGPVNVNAELTLVPLSVDLRDADDNGDPPDEPVTLADYVLHDQNENRRSFTSNHCVNCWSTRTLTSIHPIFQRFFLQQDKGKARIDGIQSGFCPGSKPLALHGIELKFLDFTASGETGLAGSTLVGQLYESGNIKHDIGAQGGEVNTGGKTEKSGDGSGGNAGGSPSGK